MWETSGSESSSAGSTRRVHPGTRRDCFAPASGPESRALLQTLTDDDLSGGAFPFGRSRALDLGTLPVRTARISFVGELGWEIYVGRDGAERLYRLLTEAGAGLGLAHAGLFCMESCRLEKGYLHWGQDIGPMDTPLHAGLEFAVDFDKPAFHGRDALLARRDCAPTRRLCALEVDTADAGILGLEGVYRHGRLAGRTTSGGWSPPRGTAIALAIIDAEAAAAGDALTVSILGEQRAAQVLELPPHDPDNARLRM